MVCTLSWYGLFPRTVSQFFLQQQCDAMYSRHSHAHTSHKGAYLQRVQQFGQCFVLWLQVCTLHAVDVPHRICLSFKLIKLLAVLLSSSAPSFRLWLFAVVVVVAVVCLFCRASPVLLVWSSSRRRRGCGARCGCGCGSGCCG